MWTRETNHTQHVSLRTVHFFIFILVCVCVWGGGGGVFCFNITTRRMDSVCNLQALSNSRATGKRSVNLLYLSYVTWSLGWCGTYRPPMWLLSIPYSASYVGWFCCWFSSFITLRRFSLCTPIFPYPHKSAFPNSNLI